jgi:hypothetical protein
VSNHFIQTHKAVGMVGVSKRHFKRLKNKTGVRPMVLRGTERSMGFYTPAQVEKIQQAKRSHCLDPFRDQVISLRRHGCTMRVIAEAVGSHSGTVYKALIRWGELRRSKT